MQNCLLVLQHNGEDISEPSLRLCTNISRSVGSSGCEITALVFGSCGEDALNSLSKFGIRKIYQAPGVAEDFYSPETRSTRVLELAATLGPSLIILPGNLQGREIAPLVAAKLEAGYVTECQEVIRCDEAIEVVLSVYGGQYQTICELSGNYNVVVMADINCGAIELDGSEKVEIIPFTAEIGPDKPVLKVLETFRLPATELDIGEADIVVGIGRGVETQADYSMMQELAGAIGAPIGGTRPAVDAGWIPFEKQIGQTGRIVAPELYVSAGISGAVQHITGVEKAKIIAINNDPQAPVLRLADLGVMGDFKAVVPLVVRKLQAIRKEGQE